jgi:hypothetical protein
MAEPSTKPMDSHSIPRGTIGPHVTGNGQHTQKWDREHERCLDISQGTGDNNDQQENSMALDQMNLSSYSSMRP